MSIPREQKEEEGHMPRVHIRLDEWPMFKIYPEEPKSRSYVYDMPEEMLKRYYELKEQVEDLCVEIDELEPLPRGKK